jgi:hypothetical protein
MGIFYCPHCCDGCTPSRKVANVFHCLECKSMWVIKDLTNSEIPTFTAELLNHLFADPKPPREPETPPALFVERGEG